MNTREAKEKPNSIGQFENGQLATVALKMWKKKEECNEQSTTDVDVRQKNANEDWHVATLLFKFKT